MEWRTLGDERAREGNFDAERYEAEPLCEKSEINQQPTSLCKSAGMKALVEKYTA